MLKHACLSTDEVFLSREWGLQLARLRRVPHSWLARFGPRTPWESVQQPTLARHNAPRVAGGTNNQQLTTNNHSQSQLPPQLSPLLRLVILGLPDITRNARVREF